MKYKGYSEMSVSEYTTFMYTEQNGRLIPNLVEYFLLKYNLLVLWKIFNSVMMFVLAYAIARIYVGKVEWKDINLALILIFAMATTVISSGVYCFTASLNYLWPTALTLVSLIPLADYFFRKQEIKWNKKYVLSFVSSGLVMLSSEQLSCIILAFYILALGYGWMIRKERFHIKKLIPICILALLFLILVLSPAQSYRYEMTQEKYKETWDLPFAEKIVNAIAWTYQSAFDENKLMILMLAIAILVSYKDKVDENKFFKAMYEIFKIMTAVAFIAVIFLYQRYAYFINIYEYVFHFEKITMANLYVKTILPYAFWSIYFAIELALLINFSTKINLVVLAAAICSVIILWFSPTMYASGNRTWFAWNALHAFLIFKIYKENDKYIDKMVACLPVTNAILLMLVLIKNYVIYY